MVITHAGSGAGAEWSSLAARVSAFSPVPELVLRFVRVVLVSTVHSRDVFLKRVDYLALNKTTPKAEKFVFYARFFLFSLVGR